MKLLSYTEYGIEMQRAKVLIFEILKQKKF